MPDAHGVAGVLRRVYRVVYAPQDRIVEALIESRLKRLGADARARLAYHDRATLMVVSNLGLSTQLAALGVCLLLGQPTLYLWLVIGCGLALIPLGTPRELRARAARPAPA